MRKFLIYGLIAAAATAAIIIGITHQKHQAPSLELKISELRQKVEAYQPLYKIDKNAKRDSIDRAWAIFNDLKLVTNQSDNKAANLSLIDIGSSLGYFTLFFADRDFKTKGIESNYNNYSLSKLVAAKNKINNVCFSWDTFDANYVAKMSSRYDVGLALSVLHHINNIHGLEYTQNLINELAKKVSILYLELATKQEPVEFEWQQSLPENIEDFFAKCDGCDIKLLGEFSNHLSATKRPIYRIIKKKLN